MGITITRDGTFATRAAYCRGYDVHGNRLLRDRSCWIDVGTNGAIEIRIMDSQDRLERNPLRILDS